MTDLVKVSYSAYCDFNDPCEALKKAKKKVLVVNDVRRSVLKKVCPKTHLLTGFFYLVILAEKECNKRLVGGWWFTPGGHLAIGWGQVGWVGWY